MRTPRSPIAACTPVSHNQRIIEDKDLSASLLRCGCGARGTYSACAPVGLEIRAEDLLLEDLEDELIKERRRAK